MKDDSTRIGRRKAQRKDTGPPVRMVARSEFLASLVSRKSVRRLTWLDPNVVGLVDRQTGEIILCSFRALYGERAWPQSGLSHRAVSLSRKHEP